jgi:hypothetical protein
VSNVLEALGFGLVLGFLWFVWPPLVLLGAGLLLIAHANTRGTGRGRLGAAIGAAVAAARRAYTAAAAADTGERTVPLSRVA